MLIMQMVLSLFHILKVAFSVTSLSYLNSIHLAMWHML